MRQRIALRFASIVGDRFVASCKADRLERKEADLLRIVERELDNASNLLVVYAVHDGDDRNDLNTGAVEIVDGFQFHVEQVADRAMRVGSVANSVELQVRVAHTSFGSLLREFETLCELDAVGRG